MWKEFKPNHFWGNVASQYLKVVKWLKLQTSHKTWDFNGTKRHFNGCHGFHEIPVLSSVSDFKKGMFRSRVGDVIVKRGGKLKNKIIKKSPI